MSAARNFHSRVVPFQQEVNASDQPAVPVADLELGVSFLRHAAHAICS